MDSSPPLPREEFGTPQKRTVRTLKCYTDLSEREIASRTRIPKATVHRYAVASTSRMKERTKRGRKPIINRDTIDKMIRSL